MTQLGTFAEEMVCHENSLVRINPWDNMKAAALISCGIATGFGSAVDRAKVKPGETVVVVGCGGVGSGAIQGARLAGARHIIAVDPVPFKLEKAKEIGATHTAASLADAQMMLPELTMGRNADAVILTPGVLKGEMIAAACACGSKDARIVVTAIAPFSQMDVQLNLFNLAMFNQSVLGTIFGSQSPRVQVPNLLNLYAAGPARDRRADHSGVQARPGAAGLRGPGGRDDHPGRRQVRRLTDTVIRLCRGDGHPPRCRLKPSGITRSSRCSWWMDACPSPSSADSMPLRMMSSTFSTPACPLAARPQR